MVTTFDTSFNTNTPASKNGGGMVLFWIGLGLASLWAGYEFWWKPKQIKEAQQEKQTAEA
jgi:hypothetical protein